MKVIAGKRYLELSELEAAGISYERVKKARSRNSAGWCVIDDPADRRRILVAYDELKPSVRTLIDALHGEAVADAKSQQWVCCLAADAADLLVLRAHTLPDGSALPESVVSKCAMACAYLRLVNNTSVKTMRLWGYITASEWYTELLARIIKEKLPLPSKNARALIAKGREYAKADAMCVVSKKYGNQCARKINEAQSAWIVSMYAQPTKPDTAKVAVLYNAEAKVKGWPSLTENAIYIHLHRPEVKPVWYGGRHGSRALINTYAHVMKLRAPSFRDALWCSDGTKLNYFYRTDNGMQARLQVYLVMDVYSEAVLGYSFSRTEDFKAQFKAAKMALKTSGHKPMQWLYDNQGGHRKAEQQDFFTRVASVHFGAQPYNAKSKPIESLIGRLQQQVMRDNWYYTGQNITAKKLDSRPNMEFIEAMQREHMPSAEEVMRAAAEDVQRWNNMPHPKTGVARMTMYQESTNPQASPVGLFDMVELFYHTTTRPVTYTSQGLTLEVSDHRLQFEVYDLNGMPNAEFLHRYTNARFFVKYDVESLEQVHLYKQDDNGELRRVATAESKRDYARAVVDLRPGERAEIDANLAFRKAQVERWKKDLEDVRNESGIDPETLVELGPRAPKQQLNDAEAELMRRHITDDYEDIDHLGAL